MSGKKATEKHYTSKGIVGSNKKLRNRMRRERHPIDTEINKFEAYLKGRRVFFTVPNPDPKITNKRFVRVLASDIYGDYRNFIKNS